MRPLALGVTAALCLAACSHSGHGRWEAMKGGSDEFGPFLDTTSVQIVGPDVVQAAIKVVYPEPKQLYPDLEPAQSVRILRAFHCAAGSSANLAHYVYADREQSREIYKHEQALGEEPFRTPPAGSQEEAIVAWVCARSAR